MLFSDPAPTEGPLLADRYRLLSRIGEGGMAGVYRAWDERLRVWRAVKVLLPEYARKKKLRVRFEREAHTMARLEHPNLVRVLDVGNAGQLPFIVMELVPCGTLMQWVERHGAMPSRLAVACALQIGEGLAEVHRHQVIHRDIKPHNVLINEQGVLKLTDFGIAQQADEGLTRAGSVMGTMGYMAPEQRNDASTVDARADVYGFAATLWKLLTDKPVRDLFMYGEDPSILEGIDEGLAELLMACLCYSRDQRPDSISEVCDALAAVLEELPDDPATTPVLPLTGVIESAEQRASTFDEIAPAFTLSDLTDEGPRSFGGGTGSSELVAPASLARPSAVPAPAPVPSKPLPGLPYGKPQKLEPVDSWVSYEDGPVQDDVDELGDDPPTDPFGGEGDDDLVGPASQTSEGSLTSSGEPLYQEPPPERPSLAPAPAPAPPPVVEPDGFEFGAVVKVALASVFAVFLAFGGGLAFGRMKVMEASTAATTASAQLYSALDEERNVVTELITIDRRAQVLEGLYLDYIDHPREPQRAEKAERFLSELEHYAGLLDSASPEAREVQQRVARIQAAHRAATAAREAHASAASSPLGSFAVLLGVAPRP